MIANPIFYWGASILLLLWGIAYAGLVTFSFFVATPEHWASLVAEGRIKAEYATYISQIPAWVIGLTVATAATRLLGGIALLMQQGFALPLYSVSLALMAVLMFRGFVLADIASVIRTSQVFLEFAFLAISIFAVWFSYEVAR